ncbi:hypothetical protein CAPTEDRAFT_203439 [Capitella teleta]|uniref:XK-related protein n=1 Tax=Capitella teleta TaxID=283909 RepID=R7V9F5_CAPTE|nr:hypothetical protein CAPTEDRAFT_203439 [Capitella teleta]|eukprot:ELU15488.1 hypothetical protein CAPTEDRAFT_203439 [Capitella teleta]
MASPLDAGVAPELQDEHNDLLFKFRARPLSQCLHNAAFFATTLLSLSDLITDVWLIVTYGFQEHVAYLGVGLFSVLLAQSGAAIMYALQMRADLQQQETSTKASLFRLYGCLVLNFPCQLGILVHRLHHNCNRNCQRCFEGSSQQPEITSSSKDTEWKFAKIKLLQSLLQCAPQLGLNLLHMLRYSTQVSPLQCCSAVLSFISLVVGIVQHSECQRRAFDSLPGNGVLGTGCMLCCQALLLGSRVLVLSSFAFMFGAWVAAVLGPHLVIMLMAFFYRHHFPGSWPPVPSYKLCLHSFYAVFVYVPVHNEYRADGEMLLCYALLLLENILMACLPLFLAPPLPVPEALLPPGSRLYAALCGAIISGSVMGSIFLSLYTCFLDTPYSSLPSSDRPSCFCCCRRSHNGNDAQPPSSLDIHGNGASQKHKRRGRRRHLNTSYMNTQTGAGAPQCYHTLNDEAGTPPELADSPPATARLDHDCGGASEQLMSPGSVLGISGALVITPAGDEAAGRPSILDGDDESDTEVINDNDMTPLQSCTS